jgi:hypothetical protein
LFETGLKRDQFNSCLLELEGKIAYNGEWIFIKNYQKHQTASPKIKAGIDRELSEIPQEVKEWAYPIDTISIPTDKPVLKLKPELKLKNKIVVATTAAKIKKTLRLPESFPEEQIVSVLEKFPKIDVLNVAMKVAGKYIGQSGGNLWSVFLNWCATEKQRENLNPYDKLPTL